MAISSDVESPSGRIRIYHWLQTYQQLICVEHQILRTVWDDSQLVIMIGALVS